MKCDRIVVIHKGKVVEDGTYDELSAKPDGHFFKLKAGIA
jgi:ABC-type multidrug transport system fused ATPase/permease subunit